MEINNYYLNKYYYILYYYIMNKFQNGKIYKIIDNVSNMLYIGSTYKTLKQRMKQHEYNIKKYKNGKYNYCSVFKVLENNNYNIELVKLLPCENKHDLHLEEGKIIKQLRNENKNIINKCIPCQTNKEYKLINKDKLYKKIDCYCGGKYLTLHKSTHYKTKKHNNFINLNIINN